MSAHPPGQRAAAVELAAGDIRVRAGFRLVPGALLLAGAPVELEFMIDCLGSAALHLAVSGDRLRQRPGQFSFTASFEGVALTDPAATAPDAGGPVTVVQVTAASPWRQRLLLNQFVALDDIAGRLAPGASGRLTLACRRPLALAATDAQALMPSAAPAMVEVELGFDLRRDDAALAALTKRRRHV